VLLWGNTLDPAAAVGVPCGEMPIVRNDYGLKVPQGNAVLWRYLNLSHFLGLLSERELHFASLDEFEDKWEGACPEVLKIDLTDAGKDMKEFGEFVTDNDKRAIGRSRVLCWHQNDVESVAMWKLYTRGLDGVAIQTTVTRLKASLHAEERDIKIGLVRYADHADPLVFGKNAPQGVAAVFLKRRSFEHENEVRLVIDDDPVVDLDSGYVQGPLVGGNVEADLKVLIQRIIASPDYPAWAIPSLQAIVTAAGLDVKVETSDLLKLPEE
jgi:hypothetical protein